MYCCTPSRTCSSVRASCEVTKSNVVSVAERAAVFLHPPQGTVYKQTKWCCSKQSNGGLKESIQSSTAFGVSGEISIIMKILICCTDYSLCFPSSITAFLLKVRGSRQVWYSDNSYCMEIDTGRKERLYCREHIRYRAILWAMLHNLRMGKYAFRDNTPPNRC